MAADQTVTNLNNSGAGSLRQAVFDVGAGENVIFEARSGRRDDLTLFGCRRDIDR